MSSYDLIEFILENDRWAKIGPLNQIKSSIFKHTGNMELVRRKFKNIGTCVVTQLISREDFEQIYQYYLPWYQNSTQIGFSQYVDKFMSGNVNLIEYEKIGNLVQRLRLGWDHRIEIIIAFDTITNIGVIVDGTHHSLALYCIKENDEELLEQLLARSGPVNQCKMSSPQSRNIFHEDFRV